MNRQDFQRLAVTRLSDAELLLAHGNYGGAYYLCGYVVECALKACIAKNTQQYDFPDLKLAQRSHSHRIGDLLGVAGLQVLLDTAMASNPNLRISWAIAVNWNEQSRYEMRSEDEARALYEAVTDNTNGVFQWIRQYW
jgi:HEPN domain-containing protein